MWEIDIQYLNYIRTTSETPSKTYFLILLSNLSHIQKMISPMKKMTFQDAFYLRMKLQNSIDLPKSPLKTPKFNINSLIKIVTSSKKAFALESISRSKISPSKQEIDNWIAKKEVQVKRIFDKEPCQNPCINPHYNSNEINLRKREEFQLKSLQKSKNSIQTKDQSSDGKFIQNRSIQSKELPSKHQQNYKPKKPTKPHNLKDIESFQEKFQNHQKLNQKITVFPVLLKLKQANLKFKDQHKKIDLSFDEKSESKRKGLSMSHIIQKYSPLNAKTQRRLDSSSISSKSLITKTTEPSNIRDQSYIQRNTSSQIMISFPKTHQISYKSPLYEHKAKAPNPIAKYSHRSISPCDKKNLINKYEKLDNRLDSILRHVRTEKENSDQNCLKSKKY